MVKIALGIGSNINREHNIRSAMEELYLCLVNVAVSPIYESTAVGFVGENFFNFVVVAETDLSLDALARKLKEIEFRHGRPKDAPKFSSRHIDIDILTYGDVVGELAGIDLPRREVTQQAFVLRPMADLVPETVHPGGLLTYRQLWQKFSGVKTNLWRSDFQLVAEREPISEVR